MASESPAEGKGARKILRAAGEPSVYELCRERYYGRYLSRREMHARIIARGVELYVLHTGVG